MEAMTVSAALFFVLVAYLKVSADWSVVACLAAVGVPMRWGSVSQVYESIGERAGAAMQDLGPTLNRYAGSITVLLVVLRCSPARSWAARG